MEAFSLILVLKQPKNTPEIAFLGVTAITKHSIYRFISNLFAERVMRKVNTVIANTSSVKKLLATPLVSWIAKAFLQQ